MHTMTAVRMVKVLKTLLTVCSLFCAYFFSKSWCWARTELLEGKQCGGQMGVSRRALKDETDE